MDPHCTMRVFRREITREDAIGSHACSLEASRRVTNSIPLGRSLLLPVDTVNCVQTPKGGYMSGISQFVVLKNGSWLGLGRGGSNTPARC
jgi:hypothetical protein